MALRRSLLVFLLVTVLVDALANYSQTSGDDISEIDSLNGVYTECFLEFSYTCLQRKTLLYLKELNRLKEVSIIGDYVKFVKLNTSEYENETSTSTNTEELAYLIDSAVDQFFDSHYIRVKSLGKGVMVPETVEEFVGRKRKKGGGGGGHGGDDGGKKKMMMMAMMCMKMKFMMMVPAMMGMMGMMSFKGMMFSMMSFMISKMMLLMKLLEKKGGGGGAGGGGWNAGGGDGGWAAGGGGAWMPAGQDYGGGGGYDANGQWQSRSIIENADEKPNKPIVSYVKPIVRYNNKINEPKPLVLIKNLKDEVIKIDQVKSKKSKRSITQVVGKSKKSRNIFDNNKSSEGYSKVDNIRESRGHSKSDNNGKYLQESSRFNDVSKSSERYGIESISKQQLSNIDNNSKSKKRRNILDDNNKSSEGYSKVNIRESREEHSILDNNGKYLQESGRFNGVSKSSERYGIEDISKQQHSNIDNNSKSIKDRSSFNDVGKSNNGHTADINKSRKRRSIIEDLHRAYVYWANKVLGVGYKKPIYPKYRYVNGVKYVYQPVRPTHRLKTPKELSNHDVKQLNVSDFNKGEIVEPVESRMNRKKFNKMKDNVNETMDDNPWE